MDLTMTSYDTIVHCDIIYIYIYIDIDIDIYIDIYIDISEIIASNKRKLILK